MADCGKLCLPCAGLAVLLAAVLLISPWVRRDFRAGLERYASGDWPEAVDAFERAAERDGSVRVPARFNVALALYRSGRFNRARATFSSLAASDAPLVRLRTAFNVGNCAYRLGEVEAAAAAYRQALTMPLPQLTDQEVAVAREVRTRAAANLALASPPATQQGQLPDGVAPQERTQPQEQATDSVGAPAGVPVGEEGPSREAAQAVVDVLSRDTGPVLDRKGLRARPGEKDW